MKPYESMTDDERDDYRAAWFKKVCDYAPKDDFKSINADLCMPDLIELEFTDGITIYATPHYDDHPGLPLDVTNEPWNGAYTTELPYRMTGDIDLDALAYLAVIKLWKELWEAQSRPLTTQGERNE